jgi:hypothetical protein
LISTMNFSSVTTALKVFVFCSIGPSGFSIKLYQLF